jgi:hypothetical protein
MATASCAAVAVSWWPEGPWAAAENPMAREPTTRKTLEYASEGFIGNLRSVNQWIIPRLFKADVESAGKKGSATFSYTLK